MFAWARDPPSKRGSSSRPATTPGSWRRSHRASAAAVLRRVLRRVGTAWAGCARRSMCPDSSSRKSRRVIRRADGVLPFRSVPTMKRRVAGRRHEGQAIAPRAPVDTERAVLQVGEPPWLTAVEQQRPRPGTRAHPRSRRMPHEREVAAVGRDGRHPCATRPRVSWRGRLLSCPEPQVRLRSRRDGPGAGCRPPPKPSWATRNVRAPCRPPAQAPGEVAGEPRRVRRSMRVCGVRES